MLVSGGFSISYVKLKFVSSFGKNIIPIKYFTSNWSFLIKSGQTKEGTELNFKSSLDFLHAHERVSHWFDSKLLKCSKTGF